MAVVFQRVLLGALCAGSLSACGEGLGECDTTMLGGSTVVGMVRPHDGQEIMSSSCASGRCHSDSAEGDARVGAPAGLNFDVFSGSSTPEELARIRRGSATVVDWAEEIWGEIEGGSMPPEPPAGGGELSSDDKEKVRNWLACGAPIVPPDPSAPTATWDSIWPALASRCVACHSSTAGPTAVGMGFVLGDGPSDVCASYDNVVGQAAITPMCSTAGATVVVPGDPSTSALFLKISDAASKCGDPMPPTGALIEENPALVALVEQWIANNAPKPASCP